MLIDAYRLTWIFAQRVRKNVKVEESMVYLKHIAETDARAQVRRYAAKHLAELRSKDGERLSG